MKTFRVRVSRRKISFDATWITVRAEDEDKAEDEARVLAKFVREEDWETETSPAEEREVSDCEEVDE